MAQFDVMISFSLIFYLLIVLYVYYAYNIQQVIPSYVETKKFRNKIFLELNNVKTIVSLGSYISILDFKYFKGFLIEINIYKIQNIFYFKAFAPWAIFLKYRGRQ